MDISTFTRKDIGNLGENVAAAYLRRHLHEVIGRNIARKTGELDIVTRKDNVIHIHEVKTVVCKEFPSFKDGNSYSPSENLHMYKLKKVRRTAEWYLAEERWVGEWQIDGILVWIRDYDAHALVRYLPHIA